MGFVSQVEGQWFEPNGIGMIRAVIADDEEFARKKLRSLLDRTLEFGVVAECSDGQQTIDAVRRLRPELLLLNVQMPDLDGFDVLKAIDVQPLPITVFTTAHDQHAMRAFEANALDCLLKPFDEERLRQALAKVRNEVEKQHARTLEQWGNSMHPEASNTPDLLRGNNRLVMKSGGKIVFLNLTDVDWVEAAANYVCFHVGKEAHSVRGTIGMISNRLSANFVRIHRSAIVNVDKIKELHPCNTGEYIAILSSGKELSCSRTYRASLRRLIQRM